MPPSFRVKKVGSTYYWIGTPTNNILDREDEIISLKALESEVGRTDNAGELWYSHLPIRLGGAPDYRAIVNGFLFEMGRFDDTPLARGVAKWITDNPGSTDGSGWGMSHGFRGTPDTEGVYHQIQIHERSMLPLSRAANQYTGFSTEVDTMDAQAKKALDDLVQMVNGDPEALLALKGIVDTAEKSKALDESGVVRKSVTTPVSEVEKECADDEMEDDEDKGKKKPKGKPESEEKSVSAPAPVLTDEDLAGIAAFVHDEVKGLEGGITKALTDLSEAMAALMDRLEKVEQAEATVKQLTETPRSVAERMKALSAARSPETVVKEGDPIKDKRPSGQSEDILAQLLGRG